MTPGNRSDTTPSQRTVFGIAAVVWITFGVVQCAQSYVSALATGRSWNFLSALTIGMPWWLSWLAFTPLIAFISQRFPLDGARVWKSLASQVVCAVLVSAAHIAVTGSVYWFTTGRDLGVATGLTNQIQRFFGNYFLEAVVTYAGVAGVFAAISFARAVRDERVSRAKLEAETASLEASLARAKLDALAMELNPHFLFNTLAAISGLVAQNKLADAQMVVRKLGELLRHTLDAGTSQFSSVAREMELLEDYLFIQRVRFSDRLQVSLAVDDGARNCAIPTMLLQPLVENAIRHGIEPSTSRGEVRVSVERNNGSVRVSITDSGPGFANGSGDGTHDGIGIANTRARLAHLYGDTATLALRNGDTGGAEAVVTLPARDMEARIEQA